MVAVKTMDEEVVPAVRLRLLGATTTAEPFTKFEPDPMVYDCPVISTTSPVNVTPEPVTERSHGSGSTSAKSPLTVMPEPVIVRTLVAETAATTFVKPAFVNAEFRAVTYAATDSFSPIVGATLFTDDLAICRFVDVSTISFAGKAYEAISVGTMGVVFAPVLATMPVTAMLGPVIVRAPVEETAATTSLVKPAVVNDVFRSATYAANVSLGTIVGATLLFDP